MKHPRPNRVPIAARQRITRSSNPAMALAAMHSDVACRASGHRRCRTAPRNGRDTSVFGVADDVVPRIRVPSRSSTRIKNDLAFDRRQRLVKIVASARLKR